MAAYPLLPLSVYFLEFKEIKIERYARYPSTKTSSGVHHNTTLKNEECAYTIKPHRREAL